jgi:inhibitor of KinA
MMKIIPYGEKAILVQFKQSIELSIHKEIMHLTAYIESVKGVNYCIPAYCSLTVAYDIEVTDFGELKLIIEAYKPSQEAAPVNNKIFKIPVCYTDDFAPDLAELALEKQMTRDEIIALHTKNTYYVYMIGFIPGFPYLGTLPSPLACKRKDKPRAKVPSGSVGLAGLQTGIYPSEAPGGWQIIGRTPLSIFQAGKTDPFMLKTGDKIKFHAIQEKEFYVILEQFNSGKLTQSDFHE